MSKFGQYQLLERVAVGGMGEVYRARSLGEEGFEKPVAIKRILPSYASDVRFVEMLVTEARIHAPLSHRNIVQIHDLGISEDHEYFIVLEFVDGHDLGALLTRLAERRLRGIGPSRVPDAVALYIAIELGEGLHFAHEQRDERGEPLGLIHRDICPSNVLLSYAGEVKLSDFGLAKRRTDHSIVGSLKGQLAYMSPEQARRASLDRRTDIFSLGAVLFEMLTGQSLRTISDDISGWQLVASGAVPTPRQCRPDILPALEQLLEGALAPDPRDRFPDARAFVAEARGALDLLPRSRAGEAGELTALLRGLLPPGRPRPAKAQSKVIRLLSELALPAPAPPPPAPARKRESGPVSKSPPPAAAPPPIAASAPPPAAREAPPPREREAGAPREREAPPPREREAPPPREREETRPALARNPAPPAPAEAEEAQRRSDGAWPAFLDLVAPPIGSGVSPAPVPRAPPAPTFRAPPAPAPGPPTPTPPAAPWPPPLYPQSQAPPADSEPLSSLEEIEGMEAPPPPRPPPARKSASMPVVAARSTREMAVPAQALPPPRQVAPPPQTLPPPRQVAPPQTLPPRPAAPPPAPPPQSLAPPPLAMPAPPPQMQPPPMLPPPQAMPAPAFVAQQPPPPPYQPQPPPPPPQYQPQPYQPPPPQMIQPQYQPPQYQQQPPQYQPPQYQQPPPQMMPQYQQPQMMPPQYQQQPEMSEEALTSDEMIQMQELSPLEQMPPLETPPPMMMGPGPSGGPAWQPQLEMQGQPDGPHDGMGQHDGMPDGQHLGDSAGMQDGQQLGQDDGMQDGQHPGQDDDGQAWTYPDQPPGMQEVSAYAMGNGYPTPAGEPVSLLQRLRFLGIVVGALAAIVAGVHFGYVPLDVLAVWRRPARLEVDSVPAGAEVFIDGRRLSARTPTFTDVVRDTAPHIVEVRLEGFQTERQRIYYSKTVELDVSVPLTPAAGPEVETTAPRPGARARRAPNPARGTPAP